MCHGANNNRISHNRFVILMLVRLNGKSVYRSFFSVSLSLSHMYTLFLFHFLDLSQWAVRRYSDGVSFSFFASLLSTTQSLKWSINDIKIVYFFFCRTRWFIEMLPWTRCVLETNWIIGKLLRNYVLANFNINLWNKLKMYIIKRGKCVKRMCRFSSKMSKERIYIYIFETLWRCKKNYTSVYI